MSQCPSCGEALEAGDAFCGGCGSKIEQASFCTSCGSQLDPGKKFCSGCGTPRDGARAPAPAPHRAPPPPARRAAPPPPVGHTGAPPTRIRTVEPLSPTTAGVLGFLFGPLGALYVSFGLAAQLFVACLIGTFAAVAFENPQLTLVLPLACGMSAKQAAEKYNQENGVG